MPNIESALRNHGIDVKKLDPKPSGPEMQKWLKQLREKQRILDELTSQGRQADWVNGQPLDALEEKPLELGELIIEETDYLEEHSDEPLAVISGVCQNGKVWSTIVIGRAVTDENLASIASNIPQNEWFQGIED